MLEDRVHLKTAQIETQVSLWLDHLGRVYRERLKLLLPHFENGPAPLAAALKTIAPDKDRPESLAAYQTFINRANEASKEAGLDLELRVDSKKQSEPIDRLTWIEGPSPDIENLAEFTREAISTLDRQELVPPTADIMTREEQENPDKPRRPLIKFFLSYTRADGDRVQKLLSPLEKELQLSKTYQFEVWTDRKILVGEDWDRAIQKELAECDFGLLFVSRDFLINQYITDKELPAFVTGTKPVIPIGLTPLMFDRIEMKGLEDKQIYRYERPGEAPRFFTQCRGEMAEDFVRDLASKIEAKIIACRNAPEFPCEIEDVGEFGHNIIDNSLFPLHIVPPEAAHGQFSKLERETLQTQNRTLAVDFLADWASSAEGTPFCAVLGEVGMGKTTTLMMFAKRMDEARQKDANVPSVIFIDLKDYYFEGEPLLQDILAEVIKRHWKGDSGRAITPDAIIRAVRERGAVVIFDGLDERIIPLPQAKRDAFIRQLWSILPPLSHKPQPGQRRGQLIISCRSHYFPTISALSSAFTGEDREGIRKQDYTACVILPFSDQQVRCYLGKMLGEERVDEAVQVIKSVHNLTELSTRPFLLSLIAPELAELEQMKRDGRTVLGVTLYGLFVEKWLRRDEYKHQFNPEHKLIMMEALAAHLCSVNQKMLPWSKISNWLDRFLEEHPEIRERYRNKPAEVLNQDFRAATFCLRPDTEKDGFRFAHTSLYEYFLALYLVRSLEENRLGNWDLPPVSDETLDFAGQLLAEGEKVDVTLAVSNWTQLLQDADASSRSRLAAFKLWMLCHRRGWPTPVPTKPQLKGLDMEGLEIGADVGPVLDLRSAILIGACLDHATVRRTLLDCAIGTGASARHAEFHDVSLNESNWEGANFTGGMWRECQARGLTGSTARWHDCDVIESEMVGAVLPHDWAEEAAIRRSDASGWKLVLRQGHSSSVSSVSWSPDGQRLLSGSYDNTLKVWDAASGCCLSTLTRHGSYVTSVAWSPDGQRLLSGSDDKTLKVWDAATGRCLSTLTGHERTVHSVSWSPDGQRLLSGSEDKTLKLWDAANGRCLSTLSGHERDVSSVAWSPDGQRLLSGSYDNSLKIWDAASGRCLCTLTGHKRAVLSVSWSPDGQRLLSGSYDNSLKIWDAASGRCLCTLPGHGSSLISVSWSPDGQRLLSGSYDNSLKVWDAASGRCLSTLTGHSSVGRSVAWSPDGKRQLSGSEDKTLKVWDAASGRCLSTLTGNQSSVGSVSWSPDGGRLLSGSYDNSLKIWDAASGRCLCTLTGHKRAVLSVSWSPDGQRLLSGSGSTLKVWDAGTGSCLSTLAGHSDFVRSVSWSPDGLRLLSGGYDGTLKVWDAATGRCLSTLTGHASCVSSVSWSPDGERLLSGSYDGTLKLWDAASGRCLSTLAGHSEYVTNVSWSPDGQRLLSGSGDCTLKVWDAASGRCLRTLTGHERTVSRVAWSPDGQRLLSGSDDHTLKVWDAAGGRCLSTLNGHEGYVRSVSWSPLGDRVLSAGADGTMREWDVANGKLIRTWVEGDGEVALVDFEANRILRATPGAWRLLGWQGHDAIANRRRLLPAEVFGPLNPW